MTDQSTVQHNINTYWDERSSSYDASAGHGIRDQAEKDAWLAELSGLLPAPPSDVLDIGTGTGFIALLAAELGHHATGIDLSEGMLSLAREKAATLVNPPAFATGDAVAPPANPSAFDVAISRHVVWTLRDAAAAFRNWFDLLRPGGAVVAIDAFWFEEGADPDSTVADSAGIWERYYSPEVRDALPILTVKSIDPIIHLFEAAGFTSTEVRHLPRVEAVEQQEGLQKRYALVAHRP